LARICAGTGEQSTQARLRELISVVTGAPVELDELRGPLIRLADELSRDLATDVEVTRSLSRVLRQFEDRKHSALSYFYEQLRETLTGRETAAVVASLKLRHDDTHRNADQLSDELEKSLEAAGDAGDRVYGPASDPATGLPTRAAAQLALHKAWSSSRTSFAVAVWVERMKMTHARFGKSICDQVMQISSQTLAARLLKGEDLLFSWNSGGLVALLTREESAGIINIDVQRIVSTPINQYFELPSRTVYLPIKMCAEVLPLNAVRDKEIFERLDAFFDSHEST